MGLTFIDITPQGSAGFQTADSAAPILDCHTTSVPVVLRLRRSPTVSPSCSSFVDTFDRTSRSSLDAMDISLLTALPALAFVLHSNPTDDQRPPISLSDLEKLKGIGIAVTEDEQPLFIYLYLSRRQKIPGEKMLASMWWTAVAMLYGICGLILWRAVT